LPQDLPPELVAPQLERARRQAESLRRGRSRLVLGDRVVVVVDDGLATGRSMAAALETVSRHRPERVTMAVPVASGPGRRGLQGRRGGGARGGGGGGRPRRGGGPRTRSSCPPGPRPGSPRPQPACLRLPVRG